MESARRKPLYEDESSSSGASDRTMKLGVSSRAWRQGASQPFPTDREKNEVLYSCHRVKPCAQVSNFGNSAHPDLEKRLQFLVDNGYVDELYRYEAKLFTNDEKEALCSPMSNELVAWAAVRSMFSFFSSHLSGRTASHGFESVLQRADKESEM
eukprot:758003-Hanusia_phi.AAC.1